MTYISDRVSNFGLELICAYNVVSEGECKRACWTLTETAPKSRQLQIGPRILARE